MWSCRRFWVPEKKRWLAGDSYNYMHFTFPSLAWGFLLVAVPLVIHLINLLRLRRIKWPAMEFLLQANKKQQRWIRMRQWLLLAMRMLAVALIVALVAQLVTRSNWVQLFSAQTTHHIVLLDDSLSMTERLGSSSGFARALQVIRDISQEAGDADSPQEFTLVRYSDATYGAADNNATATADDKKATADDKRATAESISNVGGIYRQTVDQDFDRWLAEKLRSVDATALAVHPQKAADIAARLVEETADRRSLVYVISDFRADDWESSEQVGDAIARIRQGGGKVNLIRCVSLEQPNLCITDVRSTEGTRAAGVPLFIDITIKNSGNRPADGVPLSVQTFSHSDLANRHDPVMSVGDATQLPQVLLDPIPPSESVQRRVQIYFPSAGKHVIQVQLPPDTLVADNQWWQVIDIPETISVLVIDDDPRQRNAYHLASVFEPSQRAETGIRVTRQDTSFLRDTTVGTLADYQAVYLLDPVRLESRAIRNLAEYVSGGGGLAIFAGPNSDLGFYRQWYADGEGLFPVPLGGPQTLPAEPSEAPDMQVSSHPLFQALLGERNPFVAGIRFGRYLQVPADWEILPNSTVRVLARLRGGDPLVIEKSVGDGRVVTMLSTLAPVWNNWARQPSFVVFLLQLQSYLGRSQWDEGTRTVGDVLTVELDRRRHAREVTFLTPQESSTKQAGRILQLAIASSDENNRALAEIGNAASGTGLTDRVGIYEAWTKRLDGPFDVQRFALNVDPRESNLRLIDNQRLAEIFGTEDVDVVSYDELSFADSRIQQGGLSHWVLAILALLLLSEQFLAYLTSYHPTKPLHR